MLRFALLCLARRSPVATLRWSALLPGLLLIGACSAGTTDISEPVEAPGAAAVAPAAAPAGPENPMPLDLHASAVIPRWMVPGTPPDRPAFTPHWYTPSVDPLFRRRAPGPGRMGSPRADDAPPRPQEQPTRGRAAPPLPDNSMEIAHGSLKEFDAIAPSLKGIASWYGPGFHGKHTANGEIYDQHQMTAAHPSLPMGTIIRVENEGNGQVVWVRVNDRGPYAKGRILDLSLAAARRLDMVGAGTAPVRITVLRWPRTTDLELGLRAYTQYVVQVAAYPEPERAETLLMQLQERFVNVDFLLDPRPNGSLAVIAGPFDDNGTAQRASRLLRQHGVSSMVRRYRK